MSRTLQFIELKTDFSFLQNLWTNFATFLPQLLKGIAFLVVGWLLIKFILFLVKKALGFTNIDTLPEKLKVDEILGESSVKIQPTKIIITTLKWILILVFVIIGAELLGLRMVSEQLSNLIAYLPKLIAALILFAVGVYVANLVKKALIGTFKSLELTGGNLVGNIAFYIISIIVTVTALNQAGVNTDLITNNLSIILGAILASFTIAFGLGSRDVIKRLLFGYYSRKNIQQGDKIKINNFEGVVENIDNICVTLQNEKGKIILPIKEIVNNKIEIIN
ncbi:small-conductance mechanosensitive channel [Polaribacter sp. WD7]|uniref:mechanosensitive ion channel family protein n=1 Tax=Polaribacter sp. WD7 TaxID=2269061 RepID=UPI000DF3CFDA|nr:mechanosensitive ion channel domain-containing protein [Polaribacter sp. WD7]RCS28258.1 small-conductance mechanosensitive channel [Polaribacter sp. WD7]